MKTKNCPLVFKNCYLRVMTKENNNYFEEIKDIYLCYICVSNSTGSHHVPLEPLEDDKQGC